jgi:peptide/nickel transport system substrate-binding protein
MRVGLAARLRATQLAPQGEAIRVRRQAGPGRRRTRRGLAACCAAAALALLAAACGSGGVAAGGSTPTSGGTVRWAEQPGNWPVFIFPFTPPAQFSITNTNYFQYFMYRPLYWYGTPQSPVLNQSLSLAKAPQYNGQTVTIQLKPNYRWSNGEPVDAQDIVFWMNMMKAEKGVWGGYVAGDIPDNIGAVKATGPDTVQMTIKGTFTRLWFTDNELSQITPMPAAWDVTGPSTPGHCATDISDCAAVYNYLLKQANDTSTYATSKLWKVVDGPWQLSKFALDGNVVFKYNNKYGGPTATQHISTFEEIPFTTEQSEYNVLQAGGSQGLDVGYLPTVDAPVPASGTNVGTNPLSSSYKLDPLFEWGLNYMPYDYANPTTGPIFSQLYFRKAFQYLVDQEGVISGPLHGYGEVSTGPVGDVPKTRYLSAQAEAGDQYPLNPTAAAKLLTANGWTVRPNHQTTCTSPGTGAGQCGAHISRGQPLSLSINYDGAISWVASSVRELVSNAAEVGITIHAEEGTFNSVLGFLDEPNCAGSTTTHSSCTWDILNWGGGWSYSPDYLPTGEELFQTGSGANYGGYHNPENDALIKKTLDAPSTTGFYNAFHKWQNYLAGQLPVVMEPAAPYQLTETALDLHTGPQLSTLMVNPEQWYYVK